MKKLIEHLNQNEKNNDYVFFYIGFLNGQLSKMQKKQNFESPMMKKLTHHLKENDKSNDYVFFYIGFLQGQISKMQTKQNFDFNENEIDDQ